MVSGWYGNIHGDRIGQGRDGRAPNATRTPVEAERSPGFFTSSTHAARVVFAVARRGFHKMTAAVLSFPSAPSPLPPGKERSFPRPAAAARLPGCAIPRGPVAPRGVNLHAAHADYEKKEPTGKPSGEKTFVKRPSDARECFECSWVPHIERYRCKQPRSVRAVGGRGHLRARGRRVFFSAAEAGRVRTGGRAAMIYNCLDSRALMYENAPRCRMRTNPLNK